MLKLTPEEIRQFIQDSGLVKGEEEITSSDVVKVLMALADHAAQHAAEEIIKLLEKEGRGWAATCVNKWCYEQGVEIKADERR